MGRKANEEPDYKKLPRPKLRDLCDPAHFELQTGKVFKKSLKGDLVEYLNNHGITSKYKIAKMLKQEQEDNENQDDENQDE